jgi:hypothetical protein
LPTFMRSSGCLNPESIANEHQAIQIVDTPKMPQLLMDQRITREPSQMNRTLVIKQIKMVVQIYPAQGPARLPYIEVRNDCRWSCDPIATPRMLSGQELVLASYQLPLFLKSRISVYPAPFGCAKTFSRSSKNTAKTTVTANLNYAQGHLEPLGNLFYNSRNAELRLREPLPRSHPNGG